MFHARRLFLIALYFLILACFELRVEGLIINYKNDPDLKLALENDSEMQSGDRNANQALAEKYYLAYLPRATEADQRAAIYVQLGVLFSTNIHRELGEKPDYEKARGYFKEAMKAAPDRIGRSMITARLGMATPLQNNAERFDIRLEAYKWLSSVNKQNLKSQWLKQTPDEIPTVRQIKDTLGLFENVMLAEEDNILGLAIDSSNLSDSLKRIIEALPSTDLASMAKEILEESVGKNREQLRNLINVITARPKVKVEADDPEPEPPYTTAAPAAIPSANAAQHAPARHFGVFIAGGIVVLLGVLLMLAILMRKQDVGR